MLAKLDGMAFHNVREIPSFPMPIVEYPFMANLKNLHVLLWSPSSNTLHTETLDKTVSVGIRSFLEDRKKQDYIVLAIADTREKGDAKFLEQDE